MEDLSKDDIRALGRAVGLEIEEPELTEVMYNYNALREALDEINPPRPGQRRAYADYCSSALPGLGFPPARQLSIPPRDWAA